MAYRYDDDDERTQELEENDGAEDWNDADYAASARWSGGDNREHFTKRGPARKRAREQAMARRRAEVSSRRRQARGARENETLPASLLGFFETVLPRPGGAKKRRGKASGKFALAAGGILLALIVLCGAVIAGVYRSKNIFTDKPLDETAIQERLITEEANRDKVTYFLIVGVDKSSQLTDCIWLMCFDNAAHRMNVMQIPRDTYVGWQDSPGSGKINAVFENPKEVDWCEKCGRAVTEEEISKKKHTVCGHKVTKKQESGINALIRCVNSRLNLPVDHYVLFDFDGFRELIDSIGGVDIYLEEDLKLYPKKNVYAGTLPTGENHLDGETALNFMRNRQVYFDGDLGRVRAQRSIIHAMKQKAEGMSPMAMLSLLRKLYGKFSTDMSLEEIRSYIQPVKQCGEDSLYMFTMPGKDYWVKPHPSYYVCDAEETAAAVNEYLMPYGDKLTEEDIRFPALDY